MRSIVVAFVLAVSSATPMLAQGPTLGGQQSGALRTCTYDRCALRIEGAVFGGRKVRVGLEGNSESLGVLGGGLMRNVGFVPGALMEAESGRRNAVKAAIAGVIGTIALTSALTSPYATTFDGGGAGRAWGGLLIGAAAAVTAGVQATYADQHFSRSVWLFNRELPR